MANRKRSVGYVVIGGRQIPSFIIPVLLSARPVTLKGNMRSAGDRLQ